MTTQHITALADGVYLRRPVPAQGWGLANGGLIVSRSGPAAWIDAPYDRRMAQQFLDDSRELLAPGGGVEAVFVTHANGDHLWGAGVLPDAEIIATEEALDHIAYEPEPAALHALVHSGADSPTVRYLHEHFGRFDWSDAAPVRPTRTFTGALDLQVGEIPVELRTVGPAHTSGDLIVRLPEAGVVFAGDVIFSSTEEEPGDHAVHWAGPLASVVRACQEILDSGAHTVVPGHGPVLDRAGVRQHMDYLEHLAERAAALHQQGLTALEAAHRIAAERRYPALGLPERMAVTITSEYRHLDGGGEPTSAVEIVGQMAALADRLAAEAH
ncbi:MBL fold metallo-hydrolase [Kitasatospora sp. NPDC006697]|uniref:MBL fold metallo-hydrolase n=1 Tax=Kitasatospora sp. NPDC006697 TaxID=3364020 RepID=UPI0036B57F92